VKAGGAVALALVLAAGGASAQSRRGRGGGATPGTSQAAPQGSTPGPRSGTSVSGQGSKYHLQPLNLRKPTLGTEGFAAAARAQMRNGDCLGALDEFDLALRSSTDPTLYRDRGSCQERLGNPYPAIDDYRVYVTADPDASDAEGIRQRLARLEMDVYKHSSESTDAPEDSPGAGSSTAPASASPGDSDTASATASVSDDEPKHDAMEVEHDRDDLSSSLRAGRGFGLAPFFSEHKWLTSSTSFGDAGTWSESVGLQVRYAVSARSAFFIEAGWELFNETSQATISGLTSQLGYELRIPLDDRYEDQLLLGVGLGYEHLVYTPTDASNPTQSGGAFLPRVRAGWRHMLTASVGLDLSLDGGITGTALAQGSFLNGATSQPAEMLAANLSVVWGM
jgi:hypothetical protein